MHITTEKAGVLSISVDDVALVEVEDTVPAAEAGDYSTRTIRITSYTGEILEVFCAGVGESSLQLQEVETLAPAGKRKIRKRSWLRPKVYKPK